MNLRCLGSGSSGNCYLLSSETETLILDCGLPIREIKKGLDWDISKVVGVLCSHVHTDHSKAVKDFENMGIHVFSHKDMEIDFEGEHEERKHIRYGSFDINAFALTDKNGKFMHTNNDGSECPCYGFLIEHEEMGKLLYATDTCYVKWIFKELNHIIIGCDYQMKFLMEKYKNVENERLKKHLITKAQREHILKGHMELETVKDFIKANNSNALRTVILCHLSQDSANPEECLSEVQNVAGEGVKCVCAAAGETVELSLYPF